MKVRDLVALGLEDANVAVVVDGVWSTDQVKVVYYESYIVILGIESPER